MTVLLEKRAFYFRGFPKTEYVFNGASKEVLDFLHRWKIADSVKKNGSAYSKWTIRDSDTLRSIANTLYGSEHYYWIVMMMNDMIDPFYDWPLDELYLNKYINDKYSPENINDIHHWESEEDANIYSLPEGYWVTEDYGYNKIGISNYEYEDLLNEEKRNIRLLRPEYLSQIKDERERVLSSANFTRS